MKTYWIYLISIVSVFIMLIVKYSLDNSYKVGGLYSATAEEGKYSIVKVLAIDTSAIHIRVYKNKFDKRPKNVDVSILSLGTIHDKDGFGIGHLPLDKENFKQWEPKFIKQDKVSDEELEGYKMWKEANGGVWK